MTSRDARPLLLLALPGLIALPAAADEPTAAGPEVERFDDCRGVQSPSPAASEDDRDDRGTPVAQASPPAPVGARGPSRTESVQAASTIEEQATGFDLAVSGYLRTALSFIEHDPDQSDFIGRNDGFAMANVRLALAGRRDRLQFVLSAEGAVAVLDHAHTAAGQVTVRLADAWAGYEMVPGVAELRFGQQKVPFDGESLIPTVTLPFIHRSVWNRGVRGVEGYNVGGLGVERQIGVAVTGRRIALGAGPLAAGYTLALTNGTPAHLPANENRSLATYGRVTAHVGDWITVGAAGYHNLRTMGALPDLLDERHIGFAGDLAANFGDGWLRLDFVERRVTYPDVVLEPGRISRGFGASAGYRLPFGFEPAYRIAFYDPSAGLEPADPRLAAQLEANELVHHTAGVSWTPEDLPLTVQLNYTHARENAVRRVRNDRLEILGRLVF
jgi:hypothetical protein